MGSTFSEKILATKAGVRSVSPGQIVDAVPDVVMSHDNTAAIAGIFRQTGLARIKNPDRVVIILDHCVPAATEKYALNHDIIREFVSEQGIRHFYDLSHGICHQVLPEQGHVLPGTLILGSDSHTTTHGAFGAFSAGIGRSEMAAIYATGQIWLMVPETMRIEAHGDFPRMVGPKDLILHIIGDLGADGAIYKAVEFTGHAIRGMDVGGRMVLSNMAAEMGAKIGYAEPDDTLDAWFEERGIEGYERVASDPDAHFCAMHTYAVDDLEPQVACPHTVDNVKPVTEVAGRKINQVLIGTCTNGRLEDLETAARILDGNRVDPATRTLIFPASREVLLGALERGIIETFVRSGATVMNTGCGPCLGAHEGVLAPGEVCLSTANRNFKGRMGCRDAEVYLASPATAAVSALTGVITDPREWTSGATCGE